MITTFPEILKVLGLENKVDIYNLTAAQMRMIIKLYYHHIKTK